MKLHVRHVFPCTMPTFWQMFWDEDYDQLLMDAAQVTRSMLWDRTQGDRRLWRMRFVPNQDLPSMVAKAVGTKKLVYEQDNNLDAAAGIMEWEVFPAVVPDKVTSKGIMKVHATSRGVERVVDGRIDVRIPLIGGRIERAIHKSVMTSYERAYDVSLQWLDTRGLRI
ncbi:MAG: hypothetical protein ACI9MC_001160 [Kiritimatiellia bacterium]